MSEPYLIYLPPEQIDKMLIEPEQERPEYDGYCLELICQHSNLTARETNIIKEYYDTTITQRNIGKHQHLQQAAVCKILKKARRKIKRYMLNSEYWRKRLKNIMK